MDSAEFPAIIPNIPWQAGITGEGGQSICLHSSGGYWSIAQRWKAKLNPVIFPLAPACKACISPLGWFSSHLYSSAGFIHLFSILINGDIGGLGGQSTAESDHMLDLTG